MKNEIINWDDIPDIMSKEQFYQICHISKSTALKLLRSGEIPCEYTGKKTRCYQIKKEDVRKFLKKRRRSTKEVLPVILEDMSGYYIDKLSAYPDVLTIKQVMDFTGYSKTAVNQWCAKGWLKHFRKGRANMVPKAFFVEFLCSVHFRAINQKSERHVKLLKGFRKWKHTNESR